MFGTEKTDMLSANGTWSQSRKFTSKCGPVHSYFCLRKCFIIYWSFHVLKATFKDLGACVPSPYHEGCRQKRLNFYTKILDAYL